MFDQRFINDVEKRKLVKSSIKTESRQLTMNFYRNVIEELNKKKLINKFCRQDREVKYDWKLLSRNNLSNSRVKIKILNYVQRTDLLLE